jgi:hypothetical protein
MKTAFSDFRPFWITERMLMHYGAKIRGTRINGMRAQ